MTRVLVKKFLRKFGGVATYPSAFDDSLEADVLAQKYITVASFVRKAWESYAYPTSFPLEKNVVNVLPEVSESLRECSFHLHVSHKEAFLYLIFQNEEEASMFKMRYL